MNEIFSVKKKDFNKMKKKELREKLASLIADYGVVTVLEELAPFTKTFNKIIDDIVKDKLDQVVYVLKK